MRPEWRRGCGVGRRGVSLGGRRQKRGVGGPWLEDPEGGGAAGTGGAPRRGGGEVGLVWGGWCGARGDCSGGGGIGGSPFEPRTRYSGAGGGLKGGTDLRDELVEDRRAGSILHHH